MSGICLAFDATNTWLSVGVFAPGLSRQIALRATREASARLVPVIREMLKETKVASPDWIACARGPGSFTGIRICVSTARNLSQLWNVPALGVDSLAYYSYHCMRKRKNDDGRPLAVLIDGKQERVYARLAHPGQAPAEYLNGSLHDIAPDELFAMLGPEYEIQTDDPDAVRLYLERARIKRANKSSEKAGEKAGGEASEKTGAKVGETTFVKPTAPAPHDAKLTPELHLMPEPEIESLHELAILLGGAERAGTWKDLLPIYYRNDPARAKFPHGF